jgi:hypothetical protein
MTVPSTKTWLDQLFGALHGFRFVRSLIVFGICAAIVLNDGAAAPAARTSAVDSSNSLAMMVAHRRPLAKFHGITIISPPGLWLTYAAAYMSANMGEPARTPKDKTEQRDALQAIMLNLAMAMGYSEAPSHDRILSDAAALKMSSGGSSIGMRLWTHDSAALEKAKRSELARLGVTFIIGEMSQSIRSEMDAWLSQRSHGALGSIDSEVAGMRTGVLFTTVEHRLAFPSSDRDASIVSPPFIPTSQGGVASLPGKSISYFSDATGVTAIQLAAPSGRFYLFTGSTDHLRRMLDGLSISKWTEIKSRFNPEPGRIVDAFASQSSYDFLSLVPLGDLHLWGSNRGAALQRGSIEFDGGKLDLVATSEFVAEGCCGDYMINPRTESQFQWTSLAPLVFIDEAPGGLILFLGYRL